VLAAIVAMLLTALDAHARPRKRAHSAIWQPGFSSIVVDAKTGKVIDSAKPDELRHPASLAKIMTLYLLFTEIDAGRLKLTSRIRISPDAAAQPPSKLGLKPGDSIEVEQAIKALITRSANDVAVAVAEVIAGDEQSFAQLMTRKARALGMKHTVFTNASGLPDSAQVTTARELALLALALQDRFPKLYPYFATRSFQWRGVAIGNHNRLLGSVAGVDGIKTGYTRASGFNLVTNVRRGERHLVAVVLGGHTGAARDEIMRDLITENIRYASTGPRTAPRFAEAPVTSSVRPPPRPLPGSPDPIRPTPVQMVALGKSGEPLPPAKKPDTLGVLPFSALAPTAHPLQITPLPDQPAGQAKSLAATTTSTSAPISAAPSPPQAVARTAHPSEDDKPTAATPSRGGWLIQIGAFNKESEARERLSAARERAKAILARASSYTERTVKGAAEYFRARFAGFDETGAKRACEVLKKSDLACIAIKN
jgi:D-alanyl-D-alanine carboxypeptidase